MQAAFSPVTYCPSAVVALAVLVPVVVPAAALAEVVLAVVALILLVVPLGAAALIVVLGMVVGEAALLGPLLCAAVVLLAALLVVVLVLRTVHLAVLRGILLQVLAAVNVAAVLLDLLVVEIRGVVAIVDLVVVGDANALVFDDVLELRDALVQPITLPWHGGIDQVTVAVINGCHDHHRRSGRGEVAGVPTVVASFANAVAATGATVDRKMRLFA